MGKILLIIDAQYDFLPNGSLGCAGADEKMNELVKHINENKEEYSAIIATVDWHSIAHCSFKENGGIFPPHCLEHSRGAAIYQPVLDACNNNAKFFDVLTKGTDEDREEYSVIKNNLSSKKLHTILKNFNITDIDVAGIASMYCVKDTIEDLHKTYPSVTIRALIPCIGHLESDDESKFIEWVEKQHESTVLVIK